MIKIDKHKDARSKEKQDLTRAAQNLIYLLQEGENTRPAFQEHLLNSQIDKIECIYEVQMDTEEKLPFLKTYHNMCRGKDNKPHYRSPYSNKYYPELEEGIFPSPLVRNIEEKGRILFDQYSKMYYGDNCISNFFVEESQEELCFAFFAQKKYKEDGLTGIWNSTNVANISGGDPTKAIKYMVSSSVIYEINCREEGKSFTINGNLKKSRSENKKLGVGEELDELHLSMIGKLIQENQTFLRSQVDSIFVKKSKEIIDKTRIAETKQALEERKANLKLIIERNPVPAQSK